jgi:PAS domain-containing protein
MCRLTDRFEVNQGWLAISKHHEQSSPAPIVTRMDPAVSTPQTARVHPVPAERDLLGKALELVANAIFITDETGHIVWANAAFSRLCGYEIGELVGNTLLESLQHAGAAIHDRETQVPDRSQHRHRGLPGGDFRFYRGDIQTY